MKRIAAAVLAAIMILVCLTSCSVNTEKIKDGDSVIGIIAPENGGEEYAETMKIQEKYGADKIAVETFKATGSSTTSAIYEAAERLLSANNIKAIIFAKGVEGTADAIKAIKAAKPNVECIDVNPDELDYFVSATADLTIWLVQVNHALPWLLRLKGGNGYGCLYGARQISAQSVDNETGRRT